MPGIIYNRKCCSPAPEFRIVRLRDAAPQSSRRRRDRLRHERRLYDTGRPGLEADAITGLHCFPPTRLRLGVLRGSKMIGEIKSVSQFGIRMPYHTGANYVTVTGGVTSALRHGYPRRFYPRCLQYPTNLIISNANYNYYSIVQRSPRLAIGTITIHFDRTQIADHVQQAQSNPHHPTSPLFVLFPDLSPSTSRTYSILNITSFTHSEIISDASLVFRSTKFLLPISYHAPIIKSSISFQYPYRGTPNL